MKYFLTAFWVQVLRFVRHAGTLVCLLLPCLVLALGLLLPPQAQTTSAVEVGIYYSEQADAQQLASAFLAELQRAPFETPEESSVEIQFVYAAAREEVENNVAGGRWECGYLLPDDFGNRIEEGEYRGLLARVTSPASSLGTTIDDAVAGALLKVCSPYIARSYLGRIDLLDDVPEAQLQAAQENFFTDADDTKTAVTLVGAPAQQTENPAILLSAQALIRGLVSLLLLLFGVLSLVRFGDDLHSMFFGRMSSFRGFFALFLPPFLATAVLAIASGYLSLWVGNFFFPGLIQGPLAELAWLAVYQLYLFAIIIFLGSLFYNKYVVLSLTPFLMIACFVFCPIFFDLSSFFPAADWEALLLPPTLYLQAAAGNISMVYWMGGLSVALVALSTVIARAKNQRAFPVELNVSAEG